MSGLLSDMMKQLNVAGLNLKPELQNNELTITFTEDDFIQATTQGLDDRAKNSISVKFMEGKMVVKIKLF